MRSPGSPQPAGERVARGLDDSLPLGRAGQPGTGRRREPGQLTLDTGEQVGRLEPIDPAQHPRTKNASWSNGTSRGNAAR